MHNCNIKRIDVDLKPTLRKLQEQGGTSGAKASISIGTTRCSVGAVQVVGDIYSLYRRGPRSWPIIVGGRHQIAKQNQS